MASKAQEMAIRYGAREVRDGSWTMDRQASDNYLAGMRAMLEEAENQPLHEETSNEMLKRLRALFEAKD